MTTRDSGSAPDTSGAQQIDAIITLHGDWRGAKLAQLRAVILAADHSIVEEVKWKKPSRPEGVPVWSHNGIVCVADMLKRAVRLTFFKGAQLADPHKLFNTRIESQTVLAIDFYEGSTVDAVALRALILDAVGLNAANKRGRYVRGEVPGGRNPAAALDGVE